MSNKKFISAKPDTSNSGTSRSDSYSFSTNLHLRSSRKRQSNLQAYALHTTKEKNVRVQLSESADTASIRNYDDNDQPVIITIPLKDIENPFAGMDDEEFYAILMYAWVLHESGHYLFSDQPSMEVLFDELSEYLDQYASTFKMMMMQFSKDLWNAIEDGAMEEAIRHEKGSKAAQRLAVKNETFISGGTTSIEEQKRRNVTIDMALHLAAIDLAKYDTGTLRRLLDEEDPSWQFVNERHENLFLNLYDGLRATIEEAFTTPNAATRNRVVVEYAKDIIDAFADEFGEMDESETSDREDLRRGQQDDTENQSGQAQKEQASGLQQKSKQEVAQQHANITQQTVTRSESDADSHGDNSSTQTPVCPTCGSTNIDRHAQTVNGMVAARVSAPFDVSADWIGSITFVSNDEVCGFRVNPTGCVPRDSIEQSGYKVVNVSNGIEILEPRHQYGDTEQVNGFKCSDCSHEWVPVIGGDSE
jgi:hypothetical protein